MSEQTEQSKNEASNPSGQEFKPTSVSDNAATSEIPGSQLARDEAIKEEVENRRTRLSSNLLEQKHRLIESVGWAIVVVIVALYLIFAVTLASLLLSGKAFSHDLPVTAVVLIGMCGSVPTILSISLLVGLLAKEKDGKDEKSMFDAGTVTKVCLDVIKYIKAPH